jgi:hypothetical protein
LYTILAQYYIDFIKKICINNNPRYGYKQKYMNIVNFKNFQFLLLVVIFTLKKGFTYTILERWTIAIAIVIIGADICVYFIQKLFQKHSTWSDLNWSSFPLWMKATVSGTLTIFTIFEIIVKLLWSIEFYISLVC